MENMLCNLKENIENLSFFHQVEVLRILNEKNSSILNENKNGVFINLINVDQETIEKMTSYLKYVVKQETQLKSIEEQKKQLSKQYFNEHAKEDIFTCSKV